MLAGCASREQLLLDAFFSASRLRDTTALQDISTVTFEPRQQGIVRTFQIKGTSPERSHDGIVTKDVTVEAPVILGDGPPVRRTLIVTMQRSRGQTNAGRWMVTSVTDATALPRAP